MGEIFLRVSRSVCIISTMSSEYEMTKAEQVEWQDAEFPVCDECDGRIGLDCKGHCGNCGDAPAEGDDFCPTCIVKINRAEYAAEQNAAARRSVWR